MRPIFFQANVKISFTNCVLPLKICYVNKSFLKKNEFCGDAHSHGFSIFRNNKHQILQPRALKWHSLHCKWLIQANLLLQQ